MSDGNFIEQLSAESSASSISTYQPINQLEVETEARFTIAQEYINLASALSEAVPPIAPAVQEIMPPGVRHLDVATRFRLKEADTEVFTPTTEIVHQGNEQFKTSLQVIASEYRNMLIQYFAEPLRQSRMSFNVAHWLVPGLLIVGTAIIVIGFVFALAAQNAILAVPSTIGGGIVEAIGIVRVFNKETNDQLEPNKKHLLILTQFLNAGEYIDKINDVALRDKSYAELAKEITDFNKHISS